MIMAMKTQFIKFKHYYKITLAMMGLTLLMVFLFSGGNGGSYEETIGLVQESNHPIANALVKDLVESDHYNFKSMSLEEAKLAVEESELSSAFVIPGDFEEGIKDGSIDMKIIAAQSDIRFQLLENQIRDALQNILITNQMTQMIEKELAGQVAGADITKAYQRHMDFKTVIQIDNEQLAVDSGGNLNHAVIGFIIFFVSYSIVYGVSDILEDIDRRTFHRMIISPITKTKLILANGFMSLMIGFVQIILVFYLCDVLFGSSFRDHLGTISVIALLYTFSLIGISTFVVSFLKTFKQMDAVTPVVLTSMAMIGGCLWPLEIVSSKILLFLSNLTPHKWAIVSIKKILLSQSGFNNILFEMAVLLSIGLVFYAIGIYRMKKRVFT